MDNLTHSLVGALIGQAGLKKKTGLGMPALIIGANIPDIDATCVLMGGMEHLALRRGATHGPIAWIVLPLVLAWILYGWDRWQARRGKRPEGRLPVHFGWLFALSLIGCLTHPALDWLNTYGIRLLEPFSHRWFYGDTLYIIDIWLWLGMGFATWFSLRREKRGAEWRKPARVALVAVIAYIGVNWVISGMATLSYWDGPGSKLIANPVPVAFWHRDVITTVPGNMRSVEDEEPLVPFLLKENRPLVDPALRCKMPETDTLRRTNSQLDNFLFWSRAPYATKAPNSDHVVIGDARFAGNRTFEVELPEVSCVEFPKD